MECKLSLIEPHIYRTAQLRNKSLKLRNAVVEYLFRDDNINELAILG